MAYLTNFDNDIFISYAHIDNKPISDNQGWITRFHKSLEQFLSMRMGGQAKIWRDEKLEGNDIFGDEILEQIQRTAILVSVLSPRYLESDWCTKEVTSFCSIADKTGSLIVDNKSRAVKVVKTPWPKKRPLESVLPPVMQESLGYQFFKSDENDTPLELDPCFGEEFAQDYHRKVAKLAWDITQLFYKLEEGVDKEPEVKSKEDMKPSKATIYLAGCNFDRREDREKLEAELKAHGYPVLPDQKKLSREETEFKTQVEGMLSQSKLSIHLIGHAYGAVPDGPSQESEAILQNSLAIQKNKSGALARVIWLPEGTKSENAQQQAFINSLHTDADVQSGADLVTGDFETLKTAIHSTLRRLEQPEPEKTMAESLEQDSPILVYLICDAKDRKDTVPLLKYFKSQQGVEVKLPIFSGDAQAVREANQDLLSNCDEILLYYGAGDEAWKYHHENELKKAQGFRSKKSVLVKWTYVAGPSTDDKEMMIVMEEESLIDGRSGFTESLMTKFMEFIRSRKSKP